MELEKVLKDADICGTLRANVDLSKTNWFRVGGPAQWLFKPADTQDLAAFMRVRPKELPITVLGVGSNVIIRDGGIDGVVIKLGRGFTECEVIGNRNWESGVGNRNDLGEVRARSADRALQSPAQQALGSSRAAVGEAREQKKLIVGAACLDLNAALFAADNNIAGLEFLSGIPGTIGGALRMNAGAYGKEIKDVLIAVQVVTGEGEVKQVTVEELGYSYRHSTAPRDWIFTGALLKAEAGEREEIHAKITEIQAAREASQPIRERTGGSTFANPSEQTDKKAWQVIDEAGCRGLQIGGAQMSEKHCNFMLNLGDATATDLEALGQEVRARVKAHSGIELTWEIQRIGKP